MVVVDGRGAKILVVDDHPMARSGTAFSVKRCGFESEEAGSAIEAINKLQSGEYAAILMDCQMPVMDGFQCATRIRDIEKKVGVRIPIIGISSSDQDNIHNACVNAGMDDFIEKNCTAEELQKVLDRWIR